MAGRVRLSSACAVTLARFVQQRILSFARTRYRQEYLYGLRFAVSLIEESADSDEPASDCAASTCNEPATEPLRCGDLAEAVTRLSSDQRFLIEQLFWKEQTEAELALSLGLSQRGVSKRKQAALRILRNFLQEK